MLKNCYLQFSPDVPLKELVEGTSKPSSESLSENMEGKGVPTFKGSRTLVMKRKLGGVSDSSRKLW